MKEGKWISEGEDRWRCSACEHRFIGFDGIDYTFAYICNYCPNCGAKMDNTIINNINDDIKTSDDEIIRCKDCKHSIPDMSGDELQGYECDRHYESYWDADDFCSRGERRDESNKN